MARYLLVEIDSNDRAERLRAQIDNADMGMRVVGVFAKASTLCECPVTSPKSVRGSKLGWWVCAACRRPKSGSGQNLANLLDDPGTPAKYKNLMIAVKWVRDTAGRVITLRSVPKGEWR